VTGSTIAAEALVIVLSLVFVMMGSLKVVRVFLSSELEMDLDDLSVTGVVYFRLPTISS